MDAVGITLEKSRVRDSSLAVPTSPRVGKLQTHARSDLNTQSHQGETRCTHTLAGGTPKLRQQSLAWTLPESVHRQWILAAPGSWGRGGPQLAMTEIDSWLAKELNCVETQAVTSSSSSAQRDIFQMENGGVLCRDLAHEADQPTRKGDCGPGLLLFSAPHPN